MRRRTVLVTLGGALLGGAAGCAGDDQRRTSPTGRPSSTETTASPSPTATPTPTDAPPAEAVWPQFGYDPANTRHVPDATGPESDPTVAWRALGDRSVYPPVVGDALYLTERWAPGVHALDTDGTQRWVQKTVPTSRWPPALHDGTVYVLSRTRENVVTLHALAAADGEPRWTRSDGITASSGKSPPIPPVIADGTVYVSSDRGVLAVDAATGTSDWHAEVGPHLVDVEDGPTWRTDWARPVVTDERVLTYDTTDSYGTTRELVAVARGDGSDDWRTEVSVADGAYLQGGAVAGPDQLFVASEEVVFSPGGLEEYDGTNRLLAVDHETGAVAWDWQRTGMTLRPVALADGTVYVAETNPVTDATQLHAVAAGDGTVRWTTAIEAGVFRWATVAGETVYASAGEGVTALDRASGRRRWHQPVGAAAWVPVVVGDRLYCTTSPARSADSSVVALLPG